MGRFSVCPYICTYIRTSFLWTIQYGLRPSQPGLRLSLPCLRPSQPDLRPSQPDSQASGFRPGWLGLRLSRMTQRGEWTDGQTDRWTNGKSPHSKGLCPILGPLPCFPPCKPRKCHFKIKVDLTEIYIFLIFFNFF